jgi:spermidine synthase
VTQSSSAFFATKAFWSIEKTIKSVFWNSTPYHRYLPSFWDWWFVLAKKWNIKNIDICPKLWCMWFDSNYTNEYDDVKINTLTDPVIIEYYIEWYKKYNL